MKKLVVVILLLLLYAMGTLVACTAGMAGIFGIASVEESVDTPAPATPGGQEKRAIPVTAVQILTGYGSPIPVVVEVSGDWPDLCAQLAEIGRPEVVENEIAISLLATAPTPGCPPDRVGPPFRLRIPLNWMALAEGAYTVNVNGQRTTLYVPVTPPDFDPEAESGGWIAPVMPDPRPVAATVPVAGRAPVAIAVKGVYVEVGIGSPIPVEVHISGTWPSTCAFQPEVRQTQRDFHFEITLSTDPGPADCPPDVVGLPFTINVPLNVVELPAGRYTIEANGASTTFEVPFSSVVEPATPVAAAATATATKEATVTAEATVPPAAQAGDSGACSNAAGFVADVTVPDGSRFTPGSTFYKTWRVRNSGTCTWGQHYTLAFQGGARLGAAADHYTIAGPVAPGATVDVGVPLVAPDSAGHHTVSWELEAPDGRRIGVGRSSSPLTVVIVVEDIVRLQGSMRGLAWQDRNGNNSLDDGEPLPEAIIRLFDNQNCTNQVAQTKTATGGAYAFYTLPAGIYCVTTEAGSSWAYRTVTLAAGEEAVDVNLRVPPRGGDKGTIPGVAFRDTNQNATLR